MIKEDELTVVKPEQGTQQNSENSVYSDISQENWGLQLETNIRPR